MTGMYNSFFGFRERPFQLVPNPAYLFLSRSHEEAMAHLIYAISQGEGFVEITGEVGTGKTTLCRALLENLDRFTEGAYIFNPKLDSLQLLKSINDEFGIPSQADTIKALIDTLNAFLMKKKVEGKKILLIIDEAQNLSKDVLEQLRLLSNLETTTSKLLQIILVGQPELGEMLDSHELRQLGQRITLSCHLSPLSYRETKEYIQYRIRVASQKPEVKFARGAYRAIYKYSGGIPRLVNIACDRALLTAFGLNRKKVTGIIAKASIRELAARGEVRRARLREGRRMPLTFGVLLGVFVAVLYLATIFLIIHRSVDMRVSTLLESKDLERPKVTQRVERLTQKGIDQALNPIPEAGAAELFKVMEKRQEGLSQRDFSGLPMESLEDILNSTDRRSSRSDAIRAVLALWSGEPEISALLNEMEDDPTFFRIAARHNGLQVLRITDDPDLLKKLNLPAVLEFRPSGSPSPRYLALLKTDPEGLVFSDPEGGEGSWLLSQIPPSWSGAAYIPWKNFLGYDRVIAYGSAGDPVLSLKTFLRDLGYEGVDISPVYDEKTVTVIKGIQAKHGLVTDGLIGPLTRIAVYNEQRSLNIPQLME
jgi:general secretion pathway protein A